MHFSKTYAQLLSTLPPELRDNAFEYRKLKKLINQTVVELDSLGLGPSVLQSLRDFESKSDDGLGYESLDSENVSDASFKHATFDYEIVLNSTPEPRLRLSSGDDNEHYNSIHSATQPICHVDLLIPEQLFSNIMTALHHASTFKGEVPLQDTLTNLNHASDLIVPLPSDIAFFHLLTSTLSSQSGHFDTLLASFNSALAALAASISLTAIPSSSCSPHLFSAYSVVANNAMTLRPRQLGKSDLYTWREIFGLYAEAQVFESIKEVDKGERSIEAIEVRFKLFERHIQEKKASLALPASRDALDAFLSLNVFILDVKKFQLANAEATRKILKKHAKRTTLPIPSSLLEQDTSQHALVTRASKSLPRLLVQAIGEVLLPVVPHIDDYACLVCTYVAFKPIRLGCGHFFCVRCLAKLQRRGVSSCPLCRAPTVLKATPSNLDYGLLNFIADWFPLESLEKMHADEQEIHQEQLEVLGIADARVCRIM